MRLLLEPGYAIDDDKDCRRR
jgi:hypothetical protein